MPNTGFNAQDITNLIVLDRPFHGNHPAYNKFVTDEVKDLIDNGKLDLKSIRTLQDQLRDRINKAKMSGKSLNDYFKKGC